MGTYDSLRDKLVQPFVLLGFIVSATLSLTTFALLANIEERAIERTLRVELESFRHRRTINPEALPAQSTLLEGMFLPSPQLANLVDTPRTDERIRRQMLGDHEFSVLVAEVDGKPFALVYDRQHLRSNLRNLALVFLVATAGMTLLSFVVGYRLSARIVSPILRLLDEVTARAERRGDLPEPAAFSAERYPPDEIGRLVRQLDRFSERLYEFIRRESYFSADVSHELRTPVAVISGAAEVLAAQGDLPPAVRSRLETIQRQAGRLSHILEAMLLLSREPSPGDDPSCTMTEVIEEVISDCQPLLEGKPVAISRSGHVRVTLPVERALVYVLVSNVLRNACAHTREGEIAVELHEGSLEIADTGSGMPIERFPALFERHAKGEGSQGHGLGLSIVSRICERLGWRIAVSSEPGKGTCFRVVWSDATDH